MGRPDSTQAPIPVWAEYDSGLQKSAAPPPYRFESPTTSRPTPSRAGSYQKNAYELPYSFDDSISSQSASAVSASSSHHELDAGEGCIPPPGDTDVTRMF